MPNLKKCKCGSTEIILNKNVFTGKYFVTCLNCCANVVNMDTSEEAIKAWNKECSAEGEPEPKKPRFYRCKL